MSDRIELIKLIAEKKRSRAWNQKAIDDNLPVWGSDPMRVVAGLDVEVEELEKHLAAMNEPAKGREAVVMD